MTIKFRGEMEEEGMWYYQLYGPHSTNGGVLVASTQSVEPPQAWIDAHPAEAQALIDAGQDCGAFCKTEELRIFMGSTPIADNLGTAKYNALLTAISGRTANQETIFLQLLALHARVLIANDIIPQ